MRRVIVLGCMACAILLFCLLLSARAATETTGQGTTPVSKKKTTPPKQAAPAKKYFVDLHVLPTFQLNPLIPADEVHMSPACTVGPLSFPASNAQQVVDTIAWPDYSFKVMGSDKIAIYYKEAKAPDLDSVKARMNQLAAPSFSHATVIHVPGQSASRLVSKIVLPSDMAATAVNDNCVVLLGRNDPDRAVLANLNYRIQNWYWENPSAQPATRLFFLDPGMVGKKISGSVNGSNASAEGQKESKAAAEGVQKTDTQPSTTTGAGANNAGSADKKDKTKNKKQAKKKQPAASAGDNASSTDDAENGSSDSADDQNASSDESSSSDHANDAGPPSNPYNPNSNRPDSMHPVNDMLVYFNSDGSDRGIMERNRLLAILDLPRPEVLMNVWSLQVSTRDPQTAAREAEAARELVNHQNDVLEDAVENGWNDLASQMKKEKTKFFDPLFYSYITQKFAQSQNNGNQNIKREEWGWCNRDRYCLGFAHAFEPIRPTLTNVLLAIAAAQNPATVACEVIDHIENANQNAMPCAGKKQGQEEKTRLTAPPENPESPGQGVVEPSVDQPRLEKFDQCVADELTRLHTLKQQAAKDDCELQDRIDMMREIKDHASSEHLKLNCFRKQAEQSFESNTEQHGTTRVGLLRAAIADFLFNYKWSVQYPHDFVPYDLTQSAQELNAEFNPLVVAFNRDVSALTQNLQTELQCKHEANHTLHDPLSWFGHGKDETFINDGMISVRGISGVESIVDTVTQSFFDATNPPSLTDLVKSVSDAEKNVPGVLKTNLSANEAAVLLGALNSVQPAEAKIGRELKLDITPHALAGASSAELEVKLSAEEQGNPTRYTAEKQEEDTLSRVAKHDMTTRVRVDSLKLFEVSAFSAMLQRPRSKFPIIPPFFEVPYFGSLVGWPLPGAKVYHRSTAVVSAIIVPTAADLAFGIDFTGDRLCDDQVCHHAKSPRDFGSLPLRNYHKAIVQCFASGGSTAYIGTQLLKLEEPDAAKSSSCDSLSLFNVPPPE